MQKGANNLPFVPEHVRANRLETCCASSLVDEPERVQELSPDRRVRLERDFPELPGQVFGRAMAGQVKQVCPQVAILLAGDLHPHPVAVVRSRDELPFLFLQKLATGYANRVNAQDISSHYCQRRKRIRLGRLDRFDPQAGCWQEAIVEDHKTPILDQVAFRCDFPQWLDSLRPRDRKIAQALSEGLSTAETARRFGLSPRRVSQLRREFEKSWLAFHGEEQEIGRMELLAAA